MVINKHANEYVAITPHTTDGEFTMMQSNPGYTSESGTCVDVTFVESMSCETVNSHSISWEEAYTC